MNFILSFVLDENLTTSETVGECVIKVRRSAGARGVVRLPYKTIADSATPDVDYIHTEGALMFANNEFE